MAESLWYAPPLKPPRRGGQTSPLLIINLLHFRLRRFSQPQDRFLLGKKFDKSHNGTCEAKALAEVQPCTSVTKIFCLEGCFEGVYIRTKLATSLSVLSVCYPLKYHNLLRIN